MSQFSVCKPTLNIQPPPSFVPIIEAGVTSTQSSWRVTLTPSHTQTPPAPLFTPKPKPLSLTQIWSILIVFCSNGSCSNRGETSSCCRKGIYIFFFVRLTGRLTGGSPPTRGTQACHYIHLSNSSKIPINLITGLQKMSKVRRFLQFQLRKAIQRHRTALITNLISLSPGLCARTKLLCLQSFVPVINTNYISGSTRS